MCSGTIFLKNNSSKMLIPLIIQKIKTIQLDNKQVKL